MATSARRLIPPQPPSDLASIKLEFERTFPLVWYRITERKYRSCLYWSRDGKYRFDSPAAKYGVCYAGSTIAASFQEIWGDRVRHKAPIDWLEFASKNIWRIEIPQCGILTLAGPTLTTIRASLQCFTGSYKTSQNWGAALMLHPAGLDALQYIGRRSGSQCLVLFGDSTRAKLYQANILTTRLGPLVQWKGFFPLRTQLRVRIGNLPATRPPVRFAECA